MQRKLTGAAAADSIKAEVVREAAQLLENGLPPSLAILKVGDNADDRVYEQSLCRRCAQSGINARSVTLPENCAEEDCLNAIEALNTDRSVHGVLMMRPLPKHMDEQRIIRALNPQKDVDGMTPQSLASVFMGTEGFAPCTAEAVWRLLRFEGVELYGREVVIIGRSMVVGKPLAMLMLGENATVTICHSHTGNLAEACRRADILIAAAGKRGLVDQSFVKPGAVLVDVGIHTDENGKFCGDISPAAYENAGAFTPVPGGVGVVTAWILMEHVVLAAKRQEGLL